MNDQTLLALALDWIDAEPDHVIAALFSEVERIGYDQDECGVVARFLDGAGYIVIRIGSTAAHFGSRPLIIEIHDTEYDCELVRAIPAYVFGPDGGGGEAMTA